MDIQSVLFLFYHIGPVFQWLFTLSRRNPLCLLSASSLDGPFNEIASPTRTDLRDSLVNTQRPIWALRLIPGH